MPVAPVTMTFMPASIGQPHGHGKPRRGNGREAQFDKDARPGHGARARCRRATRSRTVSVNEGGERA
jgi:hypothetical protein